MCIRDSLTHRPLSRLYHSLCRYTVPPLSDPCVWLRLRDASLSICSLFDSYVHMILLFTFYISLIIDFFEEVLLLPLPYKNVAVLDNVESGCIRLRVTVYTLSIGSGTVLYING